MKMKEIELFNPIKIYLENQGYTVNSEVRNCDVVAQKDNELVIIELKTQFSVKLLVQAVQRKEITESVYVAIPVPIGKRVPPGFKGIKLLLRKLEIGLILVDFLKTKTKIQIIFHPGPSPKRTRHKRKRAIIKEIDGRFSEFNTAGSPVSKEIITAYKQQTLLIAYLLNKLGTATPSLLKSHGTSAKTQVILSSNIYGWFERIKRGTYTLSREGKDSLTRYSHIIKEINKKRKAKN